MLAVAAGVSTLAAVAEPTADGVSTTPAATSTTAATTAPVTTGPDQSVLLQQCNHDAVKYRAETWHWQTLMGRPRTPSHYQARASNSLAHCQAVLNLWYGRAVRWQSSARRWMQLRILDYRRNVELWRLVWGKSPHGRTLASGGSLEERFRFWRTIYQRGRRRWKHPPLLGDWLCIHHYEGSWSDPNAPYWGGLQMDYAFQQAYGPWLLKHKGTADHWTPMEQIWTALRAYRVRGFEPWPNTARMCGLPT